MQWVSSRIWTRVAVSISYDDNHYTTVSSRKMFINLEIHPDFSDNSRYSFRICPDISEVMFFQAVDRKQSRRIVNSVFHYKCIDKLLFIQDLLYN